MRRCNVVFMAGGLLALGLGLFLANAARAEETKTTAEQPAATPSHRVIACYFHRTNRCPTCRKISSYIEESLKAGFADEMKSGGVTLQMVDFQDAKNQQYAEAYKISGPTLVIMDVHDDKVSAWKPAPKVWSLVGKKDAFLKYVQDEIHGYLETK